ncbi:MAG TPA: peptidase dimerization domain-containing protein [Gemmatimonadaceae bacterium]|nr:peptidase dimerization domain-containing protein [Gemmatimonadaceae bacterium]
MRRLRVLLLIPSIVVTPSLVAQSTNTERQAAKTVLQSIDRLQTQLAPARTADRLATRADADRDRLLAHVEASWKGGMESLSDWIGHNPEVGFKEFKAADTLTRVLRAAGFRVDTGVAKLATAFVATWDSPAGTNGPTLGLIGEYDALRGTQGNFHGDQHNAQSPVAIAAARALQQYMTEKKVPGRIKLFGTPAEEVGPPTKTMMQKAGLFQGTDILVRSHGTGGGTSRARAGFGVCCLNINEVKYVFKGKPSHQLQSWNGRNALEAAVMFYSSVDHLRSTLRPETSVQGVIPEGGIAPNVVPDRAVVDFYLRYPDEVYLAHIDSLITHAAKGAAMATGTSVELQRYGEYRDGITLGTLEELFFAYAKKLGAPRLNDEPERPNGYEETGYLSRDVPGLGVTIASSNSANHTYEMTADNFNELGHTAFLMDAKIMAAVLYHFLTDATFRAQVTTEHQAMQQLMDQYITALRDTYKQELSISADK